MLDLKSIPDDIIDKLDILRNELLRISIKSGGSGVEFIDQLCKRLSIANTESEILSLAQLLADSDLTFIGDDGVRFQRHHLGREQFFDSFKAEKKRQLKSSKKSVWQKMGDLITRFGWLIALVASIVTILAYFRIGSCSQTKPYRQREDTLLKKQQKTIHPQSKYNDSP